MREAMIQFLYALRPTDALPDAPDGDVLSLLLEPAQDKSTRARARAVLHLQQGREKILEAFPGLLQNLKEINAPEDSTGIGANLEAWHKQEESLRDFLHGLRYELNGNKEATRLRESMEGAGLSNRSALKASGQAVACEPSLPGLQNLHEKVLALREQLTPLAERLVLSLGDELSTIPELKSVARAEQEICRSKSSIESYYRKLHPHLDAIDQRIADAIDNYSPERLDRVDRAILRLGGYEILFAEDVPVAVAINEAIELARSFGTTESPGFINGVLDRVAQNA